MNKTLSWSNPTILKDQMLISEEWRSPHYLGLSYVVQK